MIKKIVQYIPWMMSVLVIGVITSLLAQYLKPRIDKFLAKHSSKRRAVLEAKREKHGKYIFSLLEDRQKIIELKLDKLDCVWKVMFFFCSILIGISNLFIDGIISKVIGIILTGGGLFKVIIYGSKLIKLERLISDLNDLEKDYFKCGYALGELGRWEEALEFYEKAIELKQDDVDAWVFKGVALNELKQYEEALKAYEKAIEIKPDFAMAWFNKSCVYSLKGDKGSALESLSKAIELDAKLKEDAKKDEDFKNLWDDENFKRITK